MSALTDYHDAVAAIFSKISDDLTAIKQEIADLVAAAGAISPGDQAALDDLKAQATALQVSADALVPPAPPAPPAP